MTLAIVIGILLVVFLGVFISMRARLAAQRRYRGDATRRHGEHPPGRVGQL
jgi:hypothetical protein